MREQVRDCVINHMLVRTPWAVYSCNESSSKVVRRMCISLVDCHCAQHVALAASEEVGADVVCANAAANACAQGVAGPGLQLPVLKPSGRPSGYGPVQPKTSVQVALGSPPGCTCRSRCLGSESGCCLCSSEASCRTCEVAPCKSIRASKLGRRDFTRTLICSSFRSAPRSAEHVPMKSSMARLVCWSRLRTCRVFGQGWLFALRILSYSEEQNRVRSDMQKEQLAQARRAGRRKRSDLLLFQFRFCNA